MHYSVPYQTLNLQHFFDDLRLCYKEFHLIILSFQHVFRPNGSNFLFFYLFIYFYIDGSGNFYFTVYIFSIKKRYKIMMYIIYNFNSDCIRAFPLSVVCGYTPSGMSQTVVCCHHNLHSRKSIGDRDFPVSAWAFPHRKNHNPPE